MSSTELVLHHYPMSLYAEKIRRILAFKKLPWRSVEQPMMLPKADLTALTGGYRRIPVLQIGADVYCDTACIARRIEQLHPDPPCIPADCGALVGMLEEWGDHRFTSQVVPSVILDLLPSLPAGVLDDRAAMSPMLSEQSLRMMAPHTRGQTLLSLDLLEQRLREQAFLAGEDFTLADAACYHPLWFMRHSPRLFEAVSARPALAAWFERIAALRGPEPRPMTSAEALAIAADFRPCDLAGSMEQTGPIQVGDRIAIRADDYGVEQVHGVVARLAADEITIVREDDSIGKIAVHFPRSGYVVMKE